MSHSLHKHGIRTELSTASALARLDMGCWSLDFWIKSMIKIHIREPKIMGSSIWNVLMAFTSKFFEGVIR